MKKNYLWMSLLVFGVALFSVACSGNDDPAPVDPTPVSPVDDSYISMADLDAAVNQYVDGVVLPTYKTLQEKNAALFEAVEAFRQHPSDEAFAACCEAWFDARKPWESSEAFLFGPVADLGLDPNMDSWPLDQAAILEILNSEDWAAIEWDGEYDEESEEIEGKQSVRGFHTLEFLIFKNGQYRTTTATSDPDDVNNLEYASANTKAWGNYMQAVAKLLKEDASSLYDAWIGEYAAIFKTHNGSKGFNSALNCVEQMIDGCTDIASEVGASKIGEPYDLFMSGSEEEALYAVESWYSWHSRDDYTNNIYSIRNAYYGSTDGTVNAKSLSSVVAAINSDLDSKVKNAISKAATAIQDIPQPFRNNIGSAESKSAMDACGELESVLNDELKPYIQKMTK